MPRLARLLALVLALLGGTTACLPPTSAALSADPTHRVDTLYYVSARAREEGRETTRLADSLEYGLVITAQPLGAVDEEGLVVVDSVLLTRQYFAALLRQRVGDGGDAFAVLYTHGFATSLHEAWEHSLTSRARARGSEPWIVFSWPSIGSGVAWPRLGDVFTSAYRQDSITAVRSRDAYADALQGLLNAIGGARLMVIAHSLGGQLVGETMVEHEPLRATLMHEPLRALAFVSPDIAVGRFTNVIVPDIEPLTQRLLLYASTDDRMLALSELVNDSERAGRIADAARGPVIAPGLETVDMTDGAYADSPLMHAFGTRHALRRKRGALFDLVHVVGGGWAPQCRALLGTAEATSVGVWRLTPATPPSPTELSQCATARSAVGAQQQ